MIKYIERVTPGHDGPAWIAEVELSASGKTLYFNNRAFKSWRGRGVSGNYYDIETSETYWISNPKKHGGDRHWCRSGRPTIMVQSSVVDWYIRYRGGGELDERDYLVVSSIKKTNKARFHRLENQLVTGKKRHKKQIRTKKRLF